MRPERLSLLDIVEAADNIKVHIAGQDRAGFLGNVTARAAVLHELAVIGEAARRLSTDFRDRHPEVPWAKIVALRNFVVHEYFGLDWPIVWQTAIDLVPELRGQGSRCAQSRVERVLELSSTWGARHSAARVGDSLQARGRPGFPRFRAPSLARNSPSLSAGR